MKLRNCRHCGKPFMPKSANSQYCSESCRTLARRERRRKYERTYYKKNKEKYKARSKAYYQGNREDILAYRKKLRQTKKKKKKLSGKQCEKKYNCFECPFSDVDCIRS